MKPLGKVKIKWSPEFAYAIGLLATDGNLSSDGRHINFTSKDRNLVKLFSKCLGVKNKIGKKARAKERIKKYFYVQFGDVIFYKFLLSIGLMPKKSKRIDTLIIPDKYFFNFLRGHFDGDGTFYSYWDPRWKSSFMFYTVFISTSERHLRWLRAKLTKLLEIKGHIVKGINESVYHLRYAKRESLQLLPKLYYSNKVICLPRKMKKIKKALRIEYEHNRSTKVARVL